MRARPVVFALTALLVDCGTLDVIPPHTCGNGVVDRATEDCDLFPTACGRPSEGARACRFTCSRSRTGRSSSASRCPTGWGCSVEGFCREPTGEFDLPGESISAGILTLLAGDFDGDGRTDLIGGGPAFGASKARVHYEGGQTNRRNVMVTLRQGRLPAYRTRM